MLYAVVCWGGFRVCWRVPNIVLRMFVWYNDVYLCGVVLVVCCMLCIAAFLVFRGGGSQIRIAFSGVF